LDSYGNSKICGFGHCVNYIETPKNDNGTIYIDGHGYTEYRPPEYVDIDYSCDFWALGILIYKLLTGKFPFVTSDSIRNYTAFFDIPNLEELDLKLETKYFISSLLTRDKFKRLGHKNHSFKVKEHKYFEFIDWKKLENFQIEPPYKPNVVMFFLFK